MNVTSVLVKKIGDNQETDGSSQSTVHEALWFIWPFLWVIHRSICLYGEEWLQDCRSSKNLLHRRHLEPGRPREMAFNHSDSNWIKFEIICVIQIWCMLSGLNHVFLRSCLNLCPWNFYRTFLECFFLFQRRIAGYVTAKKGKTGKIGHKKTSTSWGQCK